MFIKCISTDVVQMKKSDRENKIMLFGLNKLGKLKDDATDFTRHTKEFVDDTANSIFSKKEDFPKKGYDESLEYIRLNRKTKIEFPADESSKDKLSKLLSPDVVGSAGGVNRCCSNSWSYWNYIRHWFNCRRSWGFAWRFDS